MSKSWTCLLLVSVAFVACTPIERGQGHRGWTDPGPDAGGGLRAGQFARTLVDNTSFFRDVPLTGATADLLLQRHTAMRLIQVGEGYSKVELDSGEVGYVLTAMLESMPGSVHPPAHGHPDGQDPVLIPPDPPAFQLPTAPPPPGAPVIPSKPPSLPPLPPNLGP